MSTIFIVYVFILSLVPFFLPQFPTRTKSKTISWCFRGIHVGHIISIWALHTLQGLIRPCGVVLKPKVLWLWILWLWLYTRYLVKHIGIYMYIVSAVLSSTDLNKILCWIWEVNMVIQCTWVVQQFSRSFFVDYMYIHVQLFVIIVYFALSMTNHNLYK